MSNKKTLSRRKVLRNAAIGASTFGFTTVANAQTPSTKTVVKSRTLEGDVLEEMDVEQPWLEHVHNVKEIKNEVAEGQETGIKSVTQSEDEIVGRKKLKVSLELDQGLNTMSQKSTSLSHVPDEVDGVEIEKSQKPDVKDICYNAKDYDEVPGGVPIFRDPNGENSAMGTTAWVTAHNGEGVVLTASHVFGDCGVDEESEVYQFDEKFGEVVDYDISQDWAAIKPTETGRDVTVGGEIAVPGESSLPVEGVASEIAMVQAMDGDYSLRKMGATTGDESIGVESVWVEGDSCYDYDGEGVRIGGSLAAGDSGGLTYHYNEELEGAILGSMVTQAFYRHALGEEVETCTGQTVPLYVKGLGTAAYKIT